MKKVNINNKLYGEYKNRYNKLETDKLLEVFKYDADTVLQRLSDLENMYTVIDSNKQFTNLLEIIRYSKNFVIGTKSVLDVLIERENISTKKTKI